MLRHDRPDRFEELSLFYLRVLFLQKVIWHLRHKILHLPLSFPQLRHPESSLYLCFMLILLLFPILLDLIHISLYIQLILLHLHLMLSLFPKLMSFHSFLLGFQVLLDSVDLFLKLNFFLKYLLLTFLVYCFLKVI